MKILPITGKVPPRSPRPRLLAWDVEPAFLFTGMVALLIVIVLWLVWLDGAPRRCLRAHEERFYWSVPDGRVPDEVELQVRLVCDEWAREARP